MSELKTILEREKLNHNEKVMIKKYEANLLMTALNAYGIQPNEYKYISYQAEMPDEAKTLFPEGATRLHAVMFVPYTETAVKRILELADEDEAVLEQDAKEQAELHESVKKQTCGIYDDEE